MKNDPRPDLHRKAYDHALDLFRAVSCEHEAPDFELSVEIRKAAQDTVRHLSPELESEEGLDAASGSVARLETLLLLARDLASFPGADLDDYRARADGIGAGIRRAISWMRKSGD